MSKSEIFEIHIPDILGGLSPFDEDRSNYFSEFWDEVIEIFSIIDFEYNDCFVHYDFKWNQIKDIIKKHKQYNITAIKYLSLTPEEQDIYREKLSNGWNEVVVECKVTIINKDPDKHLARGHYAQYLENFLYQLFIVLNLSEPGCFNLYNTSFDIDNIFRVQVNLSDSLFSDSLIYSTNNLWPEVKHISLLDTWEWYKSLKIRVRQVAHTKTERAIFSMLHICMDYAATPTTIVWLCESLEALYDTPSSLINQLLRERIMLFLGKPEENFKKVKKQINEFYNLRSRFVHGDFQVLHPSHNENFDEEVDSVSEELFEGYDFGFTILISTLQKMVLNKFKNLGFAEVYLGDVMSDES